MAQILMQALIFIVPYVDDVVLFSYTFEDMQHLIYRKHWINLAG